MTWKSVTQDVDIVLQLTPDNASKGLRALLDIGYQMAVPESPAAFANEATRKRWREEKGMVVLKLWSDEHCRTPVNLFVYEPFSFETEHPRAVWLEISPGVSAAVVAFDTLLEMKRAVGRPQDMIDIEELMRER